jgi:predicted amidophosphoribosyltransferase
MDNFVYCSECHICREGTLLDITYFIKTLIVVPTGGAICEACGKKLPNIYCERCFESN